MLIEANIDALVGPTHHFGGLGVGNVASRDHRFQVSHPRQAALQGLRKAALVAGLGVPQFVWLPPVRPRLDLLEQLGFDGPLDQQLATAMDTDPTVLSAVFSSAFMWAANAATVTPAVDAADGRLHISPANLISSLHRGCEAEERQADLQDFFGDLCHEPNGSVRVHDPLPPWVPLRDEGAANHMRLCNSQGNLGINLFVYGEAEETLPTRFFPRQTLACCQALARRHQLDPAHTFFIQQHPDAISAGVFHNDVIATSHEHLLIHHEMAFLDARPQLDLLESSFLQRTGKPLLRIEVASSELSLADAVASYFFNSQIVTPQPASGSTTEQTRMVLICPDHCHEIEPARQLIERLIADHRVPIDAVHYVPLRESMSGGGGPACLRLRVSLQPADLERLPHRLRVTDETVERLSILIEQHYPERLELSDFRCGQRVRELMDATVAFRRQVLQ